MLRSFLIYGIKLSIKLKVKLFEEIFEYILIRNSVLFDQNYYISQRIDLKNSKINPLWHFVRHGWKEGLSPSVFFDAQYYLRFNSDVYNKINPLVHYILYGSSELRNPHPLFDNFFYVKYYSLALKNCTALEYFIQNASKGKYLCSPLLLESEVNKIGGNRIFINPDFLNTPFYKSVFNHIKSSLESNKLAEAFTYYEEKCIGNDEKCIDGYIVNIDGAQKYGREIWKSNENVNDEKNGKYPDFYYPTAYIRKYNKFHVIGNSRYLLYDNTIIDDELAEFDNPDYGVKKWEILSRINNLNKKGILSNIVVNKNNVIRKGILISCNHDNNYFHWLCECLPMVVFALEHETNFKDYPLLISKELHNNYKKALNVLLAKYGKKKSIIELESNFAYVVNELILPSDLSRILDRYHGVPKNGIDIVLNPQYIKKVKQLLSIKANRKFRKIYLTRRSGTYRKLLNEQSVEQFMLKRGYEVIDLANVSFEFQQLLFSQAEIVITPTGATMTNMMLAPSNTTFVVLFSDHPQAVPQMLNGRNVDLWQQLAEICNVHLYECYGKRAYHRDDVHDDFIINLEDLSMLLDKIEGV